MLARFAIVFAVFGTLSSSRLGCPCFEAELGRLNTITFVVMFVLQTAIVLVDFIFQTGEDGVVVYFLLSALLEAGFHLPFALLN
jgi:hypothetical protein